jgi:hypothetical protein
MNMTLYNDETIRMNRASILTSFGATQAVAIATLDDAPPPPVDVDGVPLSPERIARNLRDNRVMRQFLLILGCMVLIGGLFAAHVLHDAEQANIARTQHIAAGYHGWVNTDGGLPISVFITACGHAPCNNVSLEVEVVESAFTQPHFYTLYGTLNSDHTIYASGVCAGLPCNITLTSDHVIDGDLTTGHATLVFNEGTNSNTYPMAAATLTDKARIFKGK